LTTYYVRNEIPVFRDGAGSSVDGEGELILGDDVEPLAITSLITRKATPPINIIHVTRYIRHALPNTFLADPDSATNITYTASAIDSITVRAAFSAAVLDNPALRNLDNYSISPSLTISAITPEATTNPTYVDITTSEQKEGESYTLTIYITLEAA